MDRATEPSASHFDRLRPARLVWDRRGKMREPAVPAGRPGERVGTAGGDSQKLGLTFSPRLSPAQFPFLFLLPPQRDAFCWPGYYASYRSLLHWLREEPQLDIGPIIVRDIALLNAFCGLIDAKQ